MRLPVELSFAFRLRSPALPLEMWVRFGLTPSSERKGGTQCQRDSQDRVGEICADFAKDESDAYR